MADLASSATKLAVARPLYSQVRDILLERINRGDWGPGDALPNEFQLSTEFGVSIGTIRRSISELEEVGIVIRKQGRGTYVSDPAAKVSLRFFALRAPDGEPIDRSYQLEGISRRPIDVREAHHLQCSQTAVILEVSQTLLAADKIIGYERTAIEAKRFPKLETQLRFGQDLSGLYGDYGLILTRATDVVLATRADDEIAGRLAATPGDVVLHVARTSYAIDERLVEYRLGWYLASDVKHFGEIG
jgi:GntR family transcriptional regulator